MVDHFREGVFFVALASISDQGLVTSTIAQSLSITENPGRSLLDSLKDYLQSKSVLLVLDNFEQVIFAAPLVAELLVACNGLKILITAAKDYELAANENIQ